ncbi:MAG: glycosyltransferase [Acidimicrobiia bacterium]
MRILIIIRSLERGGRERQVSLLAPQLRAFGHDVTVLTLYPGGYFEAVIAAAGVELRSLQKRSRWDLLGPLRSLRAAVSESTPDAILGMLVEGNIASVVARRWARRSAVAWCIGVADISAREYGWFSVLLDRLARVLSRRVDCIMYNSQRGRAVHERHGFPPAKGTLIENAVDAHVFVRNPQLGASLRSEMGIGSEAIVVGIVARLDAAKDHETFLQAAALLRRHNSTMQLLVVGADVGEREAGLRSLAENLGIDDVVHFLGARDDLPSIYNACTVVVSSSRTEGVSNTLIEAMACGCPIVATDAGDSARIVADIALVAQVGDEQALAQCVAVAIERRRERPDWPIELRERVIRDHSTEALANQTISALRTAIAARE